METLKVIIGTILALAILYIFATIILMYGVITGAVDANSADIFSNSVRFLAGFLVS